MTNSFNDQATSLCLFAACVALACGDVDRAPPVGGGGRSSMPPVIVEAGGRANAGAAGQGSPTLANGGTVGDSLAGTSAFAGDRSTGGAAPAGGTAVAGSDGVAGTTTGVAGTTSSAGSGI
ncbi:MAG TPA: hypothetical protein VHP33_11475 [Polyangiaceae bacterium]|nr:hypothetical protein [Polyangiaceae bacterium]